MRRPNVCQFELTFGCGLHCGHCYSDCYNRPEYIKRELATGEVKLILDKVYEAGVNWICFTGGDPLTRQDFLDIYSYTKAKGFIVTIFTNSYSMNKELAGHLRKKPPFVIEMTLNAVTKDLYEKISQVKGSFEKMIDGIKLILKAELPIKIKTQVTKDNLGEISRVREFIEGLGLRFRPSYDLHARLNGDSMPCNLRILPNEIGANGDKCAKTKNRIPNASLFRCAIEGGDGIQIDPYGNIFACTLMRKPDFDLLKFDIGYATDKLLSMVTSVQNNF
jgi:MoaA/NifB/PqqE/SkfB family radical SAM enzyme